LKPVGTEVSAGGRLRWANRAQSPKEVEFFWLQRLKPIKILLLKRLELFV
jgi:hypothetical protein